MSYRYCGCMITCSSGGGHRVRAIWRYWSLKARLDVLEGATSIASALGRSLEFDQANAGSRRIFAATAATKLDTFRSGRQGRRSLRGAASIRPEVSSAQRPVRTRVQLRVTNLCVRSSQAVLVNSRAIIASSG